MSETIQPRVWFITGASTGFGRHLAEQVLLAGGKVIATARNIDHVADMERDHPGSAKALTLDVTDPASITSAAEQAIQAFGQVDVVVNNAGYGLTGAIEEATEAEFLPVFETNVLGLIRVTRAFLRHLRERRSGNIVNISSIGGLIGNAGWGYYNTTKFAVNGFSEALAAELAPLGIYVTVVEPGPFRTDFLGRSGVQVAKRIADYDATAGKSREYFLEQNGKQKGDPVRAVRAIIQAVESPQPPKHLVLGAIAFNRITARLEQWKKDLAAWQDVSLGADFPDPPASQGGN